MTKIRLALRDGYMDVLAHVFGDWAAHLLKGIDPFQYPNVDTSTTWRISHVPSGWCIASIIDAVTEQEAVSVAMALDRNMPPIPPERPLPPDPWMCIVEQIIGEALHEALP